METLSSLSIAGHATRGSKLYQDDDSKYKRKNNRPRAQLLGFMLVMLVLIVGLVAFQDNSPPPAAAAAADAALRSVGPGLLSELRGLGKNEVNAEGKGIVDGENEDAVVRLAATEELLHESQNDAEAYRRAAEAEISTLRRSLDDAHHELDRLKGTNMIQITNPQLGQWGNAIEPTLSAAAAGERPASDAAAAAPTIPRSPPPAPFSPETEDGLAKPAKNLPRPKPPQPDTPSLKVPSSSPGSSSRGTGHPYLSSAMGGPAVIEPYDVTTHMSSPITEEAQKRMEAVKDAMRHAWGGYKKYAWGKDELKPVTQSTHNDYGLGLTIIDALDTLWIMDLKEEFVDGSSWVRDNLDFESNPDNRNISVFETVIRIVGGLLSAYDLSGEKHFLNTVEALVRQMQPAFETNTGLPLSLVNLATKKATTYGWTNQAVVLSEVGSLQMELRALSRFTGDDTYAEQADKAFFAVRDTPKKPFPGLYPIYVAHKELRFTSNVVSVGAMGDSFYEYMLKVYLLTGKTDPRYLKMYKESADGIMKHIVKRTGGWTHTTELTGQKANNVMEHLCCFLGGLFALGASEVQDELKNPAAHMKTGKELTETCFQSYNTTATGIGPEAMVFNKGGMRPEARRQYQLRPETVESLFYLWRITGDKKYQDQGWKIFEALESRTKVATGGYSGLKDVTRGEPEFNDKMDSFFLAETLKYLYLLFAPADLVSLKDFVFNTEAHPYRVWNPAT